jgi:hypothetical protein
VRHGTYEVWLLVPGDRLPEGATVHDSVGEGAFVALSVLRLDGSICTIRLPRDMMVEVNV